MIIRNLQTAVKAANKEKAHAQVALSYTLGDAYTLDYWVDIAKRIEDMGASSICIKDMAGLLVPYKATELVRGIERCSKYSDRAAYTLHIRCCFYDIHESCRGRS